MVDAPLDIVLEYWWLLVLVLAIGVAFRSKSWRWLAISVVVLDLGYTFRSQVSDAGEWALRELRPQAFGGRGILAI